MQIRNTKGKVILTLLICPILSVPIIFKEIYHQRFYVLNYLAIFMALMAYLWIPSGDIYRYVEDYKIIKSLNFSELIDFSRFDFLMYFLTWIFSKLGINYEWFRLTICIIEYLIVFTVFKKIVKINKFGSDNKTVFMLFIILFGFLRFNIFLSGARFCLSVALYIYSYYSLFFEYKKKGLFIMLISCIVHFSFWPLFVLAMCAYFFKPKISRKFLIFLCIISYAVSTILLIYLIEYIPLGEMFLDHLENYTTGYYATDELKDHSVGFMLAQVFSILSFYVVTIFAFIRMKDFSNVRLYVYLLLFSILLIHMNTAYNRYAILTAYPMILYFMLNPKKEFKRKDLKICYYLAIFVFVMSIYTVKREIKYGHQYLIATPIIVILNHTYTDLWINQNIAPNGNMIKNE